MTSRHIIYLLILAGLLIPLIFQIKIPPTRMQSAEILFSKMETIKDGDYVLLSFDFGPGLIAENLPQAELFFEHLLRKNAKIILFTQYSLASPYLIQVVDSVTKNLSKEGINKVYGKDWISLGYNVGGALYLQGMVKAENLGEYLKADAKGTPLKKFDNFKDLKSFNQIKLVGSISGLRGIISNYIEYLVSPEWKPMLVHGCTSITIPEAYTFLDSGQISGLMEGIAGAAWYSKILKDKYVNRDISQDRSQIVNTMLAIAHTIIIGLIIFGTTKELISKK